MLIGLSWFTVSFTKVNDSKLPVQNNFKSSCFLFLTLILTQYGTPHIFLQPFWFPWRLYRCLQRQIMIYRTKHHISTAHLSISWAYSKSWKKPCVSSFLDVSLCFCCFLKPLYYLLWSVKSSSALIYFWLDSYRYHPTVRETVVTWIPMLSIYTILLKFKVDTVVLDCAYL